MKAKKLVVVAHCVLNQNSVVNEWERSPGAFNVVELILKRNIGIIQLPCPELLYNGINRPPLEFSDYNCEKYQKLCQELLLPIVKQIKEYVNNDYNILGVIGIQNSPTCSISNIRGVIMNELFNMLETENIKLPYCEILESYNDFNNSVDNTVIELEKLLDNCNN